MRSQNQTRSGEGPRSAHRAILRTPHPVPGGTTSEKVLRLPRCSFTCLFDVARFAPRKGNPARRKGTTRFVSARFVSCLSRLALVRLQHGLHNLTDIPPDSLPTRLF
jgi:hypothetical protein